LAEGKTRIGRRASRFSAEKKEKRPNNGQNKIVMAALQKGMPESICTNDGEVLILSFVLLRVKRKEGREFSSPLIRCTLVAHCATVWGL
jgi:hypothetical protein